MTRAALRAQPMTGRVPGLLATLAAAALLLACSSSSDKAPKPAKLVPVAAPIPVQRVWDVDVGRADGTFLTPAVLENALFAASRDGDLLRLDPATGKQLWRVRVDGGIAAGVGSDGTQVAVVGPRGNVITFDAGGKRMWEAQSPSDVTARPLVGHGLVIVRSTDQRLTAYEAATGKRRWIYTRQQPSLSLRVEADPVFSGDNALVGFPGGRLNAVTLSNGAGRWDAGVSEPKGATEVERLADVVGMPALIEDMVCAGSFQGRVACFDVRNGDLRWAREFSAGAGVAVSADAVIGVDAESHVNAFKRSSGAGLWQNGALAHRALSAPVVIGTVAAVADFEGVVHFLSLDDGRIVGRVDAGGGPVTSTPQPWNGGAVFQNTRGHLFLLRPGQG